MNECTLVTYTTEYLNFRVLFSPLLLRVRETSLPASSVCFLRDLSLGAGVVPVAVTPLKLSDSRSTGTPPFSGEQGKEARDHGA